MPLQVWPVSFFNSQISYRAQQGITSNSVVKMVAIWVFAFLLHCPAILFWECVAGHSVVAVDQCYAEFFDNWYFLLCTSTLEFFVPLLSVTYFNVRIFHKIRRCQQHGRTQVCEPPRSSSLSWRYCLSLRQGVLSPPLEAEDSVSSSMRPKKERFINESSSPSRGSSCPSRGTSVTPKRDFSLSSCARSRSKLQQDKKTAKSLAISVCVFAVCWAPYTLLMIIRGACKGSCVHNSLYEITFWLLRLNSSLNPFLYPLCHIKFWKAFMKMLCPQKFATLRLGSL